MRPAKEFQPSFWYPEELGHCFWPIHYVVKVLAGPGQIRDQVLSIRVEVDKQKAAVVFHARGLEPPFFPVPGAIGLLIRHADEFTVRVEGPGMVKAL